MKKIGLSSLVTGLLIANVVVAGPTDVEDGALFIAGNNALTVEAADPAVSLPAACKTSHPVPGAVDVIVSNGWAHVTSNIEGVVEVTSIDVSSCLMPKNFCDAEPVVDLHDGHKGELFIPCLEVNGKRYDITMEQRGSSMNWEVTGLPESEHYHHHDDHEHHH